MPIKITTSRTLNARIRGEQHHVQIVRSPNPMARKQWVKATATVKPATFTQKAVVETELLFLPFMEAIQKAQARWPGKPVSYTTLSCRPADEPEKKE